MEKGDIYNNIEYFFGDVVWIRFYQAHPYFGGLPVVGLFSSDGLVPLGAYRILSKLYRPAALELVLFYNASHIHVSLVCRTTADAFNIKNLIYASQEFEQFTEFVKEKQAVALSIGSIDENSILDIASMKVTPIIFHKCTVIPLK